MCWSSPKRQAVEVSKPKTNETETPTVHVKIKCPEGSNPCNSTDMDCSVYGQCCYKNGDKEKFCRCGKGRDGDFCQNAVSEYDYSHAKSQGTQAVAAFSALIGVIVIILFLALVVLQIKYYRERKKRRHGDREQNKISRPDASEKGSKKVLITQPGYSWRESVRRTGSKAAHKFRNTLSNSVPDDLFGAGLKLAIIGGFKPTDHQSTVGKGEFKALTTLRCFSADPELGGRQVIFDQEDNVNANASNEPIPAQIPATSSAAVSGEAATEDTVM